MLSELSSKTLKTFFDASSIPLTLASPVFEDCPVILCNDAFLDLTGYTRDEVIGRNCRFLQGRQTDPVARRALRAAIDEPKEALVQITNYRKDGSEFENFVFVLPILDSNGRLLYLLRLAVRHHRAFAQAHSQAACADAGRGHRTGAARVDRARTYAAGRASTAGRDAADCADRRDVRVVSGAEHARQLGRFVHSSSWPGLTRPSSATGAIA